MAGIWKHPRSRYWTACFRDQHGRQRRVSTKETDRKRAKRIAEEFEKAARTKRTLRQAQTVLDRLHEELSGEKISRKSLRDFSRDWLAVKGPETTSRTIVFYRATVERLIGFLGAKADSPLTDITQADLIAYRNSLVEMLTGGTVNHHLTALRTLFKAARRDGVITTDPAEFVGAVRTRTQQTRRPFTIPEIQSVLSIADPEWQSLGRVCKSSM
jgi:integrase